MMERYFRIQYLFLTASGFVEYFSHSLVNSLNTQLGVEMMVTRRMNYEVFRNHQFAHAPLALSLPPWAPWWIGMVGALFAVVFAKQPLAEGV